MQEYRKERANCCEINIFVKCREESHKKEDEKPCVIVNIEVECDEN